MTRWWALAIVAIALVCGGVSPPAAASRQGAQCELGDRALPANGSLCKRGGQPPTTVPRVATGNGFVAILPPSSDLPAPRAWIAVRSSVPASRIDRAIVAAAARAPPG